MFRVTDGEQAMAFLLQQGAYATAPRPDLVLLDLNMPRKSGFDVLAETKRNPRLRDINVVVFSTSTLPYDREKSLELGADDYSGTRCRECVSALARIPSSDGGFHGAPTSLPSAPKIAKM